MTIFAPLLLNLLLIGCVGTVQETAAPQNLQFKNPPQTFSFPGIVTARAISHNKIEIEFFPASGSDIQYKLFVNNSQTPVSIDPSSLQRRADGKSFYIIDNLNSDTEYKLKLKAVNAKTGDVSINENETFARTFDNVTANFKGVSKLALVPGDTDGAIRVDWIAPMMSGIFTAGPYDPVHYEVTIISEIGGVANLNNPAYTGMDKRTILVPMPPARATPLSNPSSVVVDGLMAGTRYFAQVRAINTLYQDYAENPAVTTIPVDREINTKYLDIKTENAGTLFDFRQDNVILANAPAQDAFDKIDIFWQAGTGSFTSYRIFVRKYDGSDDPRMDDKLTETVLVAMTNSGSYSNIAPLETSKRISGLENGAYYQVKVALCKVANCPVQSADPNVAIISDLKAIRVVPTLSPFSGINAIEPPGQYNEKDVVNLRFDPPLIDKGFATAIEFYCVDPNDKTNMVKFDGNNQISGSGIASCEGLWLQGTPNPIASYNQQKIKGLITDGTKQYCFAATPAILGYGTDIRLAPNQMIVRCSYPEVFPPTLAQFPGINSSCSVSATKGTVTWNLPTGGIYSGFKVFWKEKNSSSKFSFPHAIAGDPGYASSPLLTAADITYEANNLVPGRTYQIGVIAVVDLDPPASDLYSEYNLNIKDCVVPLPEASFKGFTRIFAVGPKADGRVPNDAATKTTPTSAFLYEAIDANGIPYEVAMDSITSPNPSLNFSAPPGRDNGVTFSAQFDGIPNSDVGYSMSKDGIVSLAWEEVDLSFDEADAMFASNMPGSAPRAGRKWGYKVYRSSDNKLTWQELTLTNGNVYSMPFEYRNRPTSAPTSKRMAFFTDYSVKALSEVHDSATGRDIERARTYYYKIAPVFDGNVIKYSTGTHHIVKVTLPPPNMALVHRWMANRAHCLEFDKVPSIGENYSCPYNGIGAKPTSIPYIVGNTALDQGGDLLIDRNELGCRYTRGERVANPELGASTFDPPAGSKRYAYDGSTMPLFRGWRTISQTEDPTTPFKGCVGDNNPSRETSSAADYPAGFQPEYSRLLQGDCIGSHLTTITTGDCTADQYLDGKYTKVWIMAPGVVFDPSNTPPDCSAGTSINPTNLYSRYTGAFAPNELMQSEFMAVFYNRASPSLTGGAAMVPIEGPTTTGLSNSRFMASTVGISAGGSQCSINLASIAPDGYMRPRWVSANELGTSLIRFKGQNGPLLHKTVAELTEVSKSLNEADLTFYNGDDTDPGTSRFRLPSATLRSSPRFRNTTRVTKIFASNSAKLPPLGKLNPDVAQKICSNFFVQTGVASDGGNFAPNMQPIAKRALRRPDFVTAAMWPDHFDSAQISAIEATAAAGSCNGNFKNITGSTVSKGNVFSNRMPANNNLSNSPLITGSSPFGGLSSYSDSYHSAKCISKFGIQDLVGNMSESNSERIFCDYTQDQIRLGPVVIGWGAGTAAESKGEIGFPAIPYFNDSIEAYNVMLLDGDPVNGPTTFELQFRSGAAPRTDIKPWVSVSTNSGYCSVVDNDPLRRENPEDFFKDVSTGVWFPLYLPGGALNTSMVLTPQNDQDSVIGWRNGDGRFLDFGPQGMAAAFNQANTLALSLNGVPFSATTAKSKYFNPVIGLPLICNGTSCDDPLISGQNDNTLITTADLAGNVNPDPVINDIPSITDFPVGNSQITHSGISQFVFPGEESLPYPVNTSISTGIGQVLQAIEVEDPVSMANPVFKYKRFPEDFNPGSPLKYYQLNWLVPRGTNFSVTSGGRSNTAQTGRFSASISQASNIYSGSNEFTSGTRCAVMINQED